MSEGQKPNAGRKTPVVVQVSDAGRLPPQDKPAEEAVLGALMLETDAYYIINEILRPESFYEKSHQIIFKAISYLALNQRPIDMLTVTQQLRKTGELEQAGGPFYIAQLTEKVASTAHLEYHASAIIAKKYLARELIRYTGTIQGKAFDETTDADELMQEAEGELFKLSQRNIKNEAIQIDPIIKASIDLVQKAATQKEGLSGLRTGFSGLDKITSGWQRSDLIVIAARPAMGKTAFALSMAKNMAVNFDIPVAIFSLEMSNIQLVNRLIVNVTEIPGEKIKSGQLAPYEWEQLDSKIKDLYHTKIYVDDTPSLSVFELRTKARRLVREHDIKCLFIDYLQLMNASGMNFGSREQEVSMISRSLKGLAKELNIPIIALSQLNRAVETRQGKEGKRPQLADLRESGAIEQDADIVCFIHRPEYYKIYEDENGNSLIGLAEIIVAKHRNGMTGDLRLRFKNEFAKFINIDDDLPIREYTSKSSINEDSMPAPLSPAEDDFVSHQGNSEVVPF
ncbi:MAG: replicative DNA helicase [Tannerella sp.]|jgi:replicative DNA helicase|nr:replicative DNA helicase [Tannerella sp.]